MPKIYDNIENQLSNGLTETLKLSKRGDFCVGYFNLQGINRLVSAYLDIAEVNALQHKAMTMNEWIDVLDGFIKMSRQNVLIDATNAIICKKQ